MKQPHWNDPYYAAEFMGALVEGLIEVTKTDKKPDPPKPKTVANKGQSTR